MKMTGKVLTLNETVLAPFNVVPVLVLMILIPVLYCAIQPAETETLAADSARLIAEDQAPAGRADEAPTLARRLERAWVLNLIVVIAGVAALSIIWSKSGFNLDINSVIFLFFIAGLLLHWRPIAYVEAINNAARVTGPLILQYPLYGGIMGIMTTTGLADVISKSFCRIFERSHLTVLELYRFDDHQSVYPELRRTLGGARPICGTGGCSATYVAGRDCHGSCHGRASRQHDPAILGLAGLSDSRDKPAASDGIYGHEFFRRGNRVWAGAADVGVAGLGTSRNGLQYWSRW
jgi:hypothetical protein